MEDILRKYPFSNLPQESLKLLSHCPVCHHRYSPFTAQIVEERDGAHLIHIQCKDCQSSIVALIVSGGFGVSSIGFITDLSSEDVVRLKDTGKVSSDDVLSLYKALEDEHWMEQVS